MLKKKTHKVIGGVSTWHMWTLIGRECRWRALSKESRSNNQAFHCPILPHTDSSVARKAKCWVSATGRVATQKWTYYSLRFTLTSHFPIFFSLSFYFFKYELKSHLSRTQKPSLAFSAYTDLSSLWFVSWLMQPKLCNLALQPTLFCTVCSICRGIWWRGIIQYGLLLSKII